MTPLREEEEESEPVPEEPPADDSEQPAAQPPPRSPLEAPRPGDPIPKPGPPKSREELAKEYYGDADRFAKQFPDLRLQIVAAFFRVADAFRDTEWGMKALDRATAYAKGWQKEAKADSADPDAATPETQKKEPATARRSQSESDRPRQLARADRRLRHAVARKSV